MRRRRRTADAPPDAVDVAASAQVACTPPFPAVDLDGGRWLLARRSDGQVVAFPDACPHLGQPLRRAEVDRDTIVCRHHRHRYALVDGRCVWPGTAHDEPLTVRHAQERDGRVWLRAGTPGGTP